MRSNPWFRIGLDAWSLGVEASLVMGLRTMALAMGGSAAQAEANRMIAEKVEAGLALQAKAWSGSLGVSPAAITAKTAA